MAEGMNMISKNYNDLISIEEKITMILYEIPSEPLPRFKIIISFGKKKCFNLIVILRNQEYFTIYLPILPLFLLFPTKFNNIIY